MPVQNELNIIIAGVGGQGNVRGAQIIGTAAVRAGYHARVSDVYGIAQRGGPVVSHVRIGKEIYGSMVEEHTADIVIGLEPMEALRAAAKFLRPGGIVVLSTRPIYPVEVNTGKATYPALEAIMAVISKVSRKVVQLDATKIAEDAGIPIAANIVMLGVLSGLGILPFPEEAIKQSIRENIPRSIEQNLKAFDSGSAIGRANSR
ncbi:MAG: indolepyruvate ferredoxin oxidoreductase subunit beta [Candidatus Methanomethylicaceae archaeon]|jgi:indolepyruvate ferredoxin oxidoreductase beta subunit